MENRKFVYDEAENIFHENSKLNSNNKKFKELYSNYLIENGLKIKQRLNKDASKKENKILKIIRKLIYIIS